MEDETQKMTFKDKRLKRFAIEKRMFRVANMSISPKPNWICDSLIEHDQINDRDTMQSDRLTAHSKLGYVEVWEMTDKEIVRI